MRPNIYIWTAHPSHGWCQRCRAMTALLPPQRWAASPPTYRHRCPQRRRQDQCQTAYLSSAIMTPTPARAALTNRVDTCERDNDKNATSATPAANNHSNNGGIGGGKKKRSQHKMPSGGQAQSLNHLLNFTLPPRQPQGLPPLPRRSRKTAAAVYGIYNKESGYKTMPDYLTESRCLLLYL